MARCVVIQPFDNGGRYDKRYDDVYRPAIEAAQLEAYRVDRDPGVSKPVEAIEAEIKAAEICLADITLDNPNVWYELGYAFACGRPVVMVCAVDERTGKKYPFDIQHRTIIEYAGHSSRDFDELRVKITARLAALIKQGAALSILAASDPIATVAGLSNPEHVALAVLAGASGYPSSSVGTSWARKLAERSGLTDVGFNLAIRRLSAKQFLEFRTEVDPRDDEPYDALQLTDVAWHWIDDNEERFLLHRDPNEDLNTPF